MGKIIQVDFSKNSEEIEATISPESLIPILESIKSRNLREYTVIVKSVCIYGGVNPHNIKSRH